MQEPHWVDSLLESSADFGEMAFIGGCSTVLGILASLAFVCFVVLCPKTWIDRLERILTSKIFFGIVWLLGFAVYDIGMCTGQYISLLTNAPLAIVYAFRIFVFDSDVSEIHEVFHSSWIYSFMFASVHFLAALVTTSFLIRLFGYNMLSRLRMWWNSLSFGRDVKETFVFWGLNEAAFNLIGSIKEHYKGNPSDYRIVVVRTFDGESSDRKVGIERIFDFLSMTSRDMRRLEGSGCFVVGKYINFSDMTVEAPDNDIIGSVLRMKSLKRMLLRHTTDKVHMLFLSDDGKANLHDTSIFLGDTTINSIADTGSGSGDHKVIFYCRTRYNSVHRVIEDQYSNGAILVNVVDTSHISVDMLKKNKELLPVNFVKVEADATVSTPFNSLVVGFSEVGQDAVRFLYEFGAFVKSHPDGGRPVRSDFSLHVVDRRMADLAGPFVAGAPAIKFSMPFLKECGCRDKSDRLSDAPDAKAPITLHNMDCCGVEFYLHLEEWIKSLNYIVLATDDDELNLSLAVRIFKAAVKCREDVSDMCILVRAHNDSDGHLHRVAQYYNRLWLAQTHATSFDGKHHRQTTIERKQPVSAPIHIFGLDNETYTYGNIIDDTTEREAADFKELYERSTNRDYNQKTDRSQYAWYTDIAEYLNPCDKEKNIYYAPTYSGVMALRRTQGQDMANSMHKLTKIRLAEKALEAAGLAAVDWASLIWTHENVTYTLKTGKPVNPLIVRILNTLAQTEHLRWNASHRLLGYVHHVGPETEAPFSYKHEGKMHHSCLVEWDKLPQDKQSYDYNVVDVTLDIINPNRPQKKPELE